MCACRKGFVALAVAVLAPLAHGDYPIALPGVSQVRVTDGFWFDRLETNRLVTLKANLLKCSETPRIANFTNAAARAWGRFGGIFYDDSDVFKVMEGASYVLAAHPDPELERYMVWLIGQIAKAQEPDGYLYTARLLGAENVRRFARWEKLKWSHELYNQGHMIEAAVAWKEVTGRDDFLSVARKSADLMCRTFGPGPTQIRSTSGHQEIELALCRLYRATGECRYLDLAKFFLDMRGRADLRETWGVGVQDHLPVLEQNEALGHAVRAGYQYCGMADVSALLGDRSYAEAIGRLWDNVVSRKLHLNGGIGAWRHAKYPKWGDAGEAFGSDYDLPNVDAYLETCAAIANALWNVRLFRIHGDAKYVDVLERTIYNGFASGVSLSGNEFFYPNPLCVTNGYRRSKWFTTSCCPVNIVRFIPQIPSFAYASRGNTIYWNLFMSSKVEVEGVKLSVNTGYPWTGDVRLTLTPSEGRSDFALKVRVPGWACGRPVPSDLYVQTEPSSLTEVSLAVNGKEVPVVLGADGYVTIERKWSRDDTVTLSLPLPVKRIRAHANVKADAGRLAVERGPVVYCAEGVDNPDGVCTVPLPADATFSVEEVAVGGGRYPSLKSSTGLVLVPSCIWGNRQPGNDMQTWFADGVE